MFGGLSDSAAVSEKNRSLNTQSLLDERGTHAASHISTSFGASCKGLPSVLLSRLSQSSPLLIRLC